ncbi:hypothetical protein [Flavobacterium sp. JP2137]|uniref:hypothetical protein n=1 Tax=Flavobacterium sp. JP2137 TaxID=3414510 RepID=UPI003D2FBE91
MNIKEKLLQTHLEIISDKIDAFQEMISQMALDAQNDAKSSAGDKHETGLSMMHLEQEKLSAKVAESIDIRAFLSKIDGSKSSDTIGLGSFVRINSIYLFISAALPKLVIDEMSILCISTDAPLAQALMGKKLNDVIVFNGSDFTINHLE